MAAMGRKSPFGQFLTPATGRVLASHLELVPTFASSVVRFPTCNGNFRDQSGRLLWPQCGKLVAKGPVTCDDVLPPKGSSTAGADELRRCDWGRA